ncbi:TIGR03545 family protein [Pseudidiomarina sp. PP-1MA]|uniref:TIGR03545 family protein n=1 Tax=Pseudidiomarina sp. PP-1MA TaxID=3237706 RepID=A0AB39X8P0_9GAMM
MTTKTTAKPVRKSAIRWPGLAAFVVICALLVAFSWLLLDTILRWTLERTVGTLNGAEVNIAKVEHSWSPLGLTITGIEVTDPGQPEFNRLQIGQISGNLNVEQLLLGRFHFEEVVSSGIRVHQQRASAGEVYQAPSKDELSTWAKQGLDSLNVKLPDVDEIVARVDLQTPAAIAAAKTNFAEQKERVKQAQANIPSEEDLKSYQAELKALTDTKVETPQQLQQLRDKLKALQAKFKADRERLVEFKAVVEQSVEVLKADVERVKDAPEQDLARVEQLIQLNSEGLNEITAVLFGEQMRQWSQYILLAYEQLAPMLAKSANEELVKPQRGEGIWFEFTDKSEPPSFLIKKAITEFVWNDTLLDVNWSNITHQHEQLGQPTTFIARADNSALWQALNLNGEMAFTVDGLDAKQQWQVQGIQLQQLALSERSEFVASIASALLDSEGSIGLRNNQFDGGGVVKLTQLEVLAEADNRWTQVVADALKTLQRLDIRADISGELLQPSFNLSSDLDRQLGDALKSSVMAAGRTQLAEFSGSLQQQSDGFLGENQADLEQLIGLLGDAEQRDQQLQEMLQAKVEDKLKDSVKDKLKGLFGG